jgi:arsenate reductase-like glutaredoxin family protein
MIKKTIFISTLFLFISQSFFAQNKPIKIEDEKINNRLILYAVNENLQDFDILLTVKGTGFRQRTGKPRLTRVPGASRVKVKSLVIERGMQPLYTYTIEANDSLSRRVIKPGFTKIKINPPMNILMYTSERCITCDSFIGYLDNGVYKYETLNLSENPKKVELLKKYLPSIDTLTTPVFNLGGLLYTKIETYEQLLKKLEEEKQ